MCECSLRKTCRANSLNDQCWQNFSEGCAVLVTAGDCCDVVRSEVVLVSTELVLGSIFFFLTPQQMLANNLSKLLIQTS